VVQSELEAARGWSALRRGKSAAMVSREVARNGEGAATGVDQRPRGRGAHGGAGERGGRVQPTGGGLTATLSEQGSFGASDTWALADRGREREMREAGCVSRPGEKRKMGRSRRNKRILFIYSNRIQTSLNGFDQKVDLPRSKNSK
jgi:hypothetical protein